MATIYKRTRQKPISADAEITVRKGIRYAIWRNSKTNRLRRTPLTADGDRIVIEEDKYTIEYFDEHGARRRVSAGTSDMDAAQ